MYSVFTLEILSAKKTILLRRFMRDSEKLIKPYHKNCSLFLWWLAHLYDWLKLRCSKRNAKLSNLPSIMTDIPFRIVCKKRAYNGCIFCAVYVTQNLL